MQLNRMIALAAAAVIAKSNMLVGRAQNRSVQRKIKPTGKPQGYAGVEAVHQAQARGLRYIQRQIKRQSAGVRIGKPPRHIREKIELLRSGA